MRLCARRPARYIALLDNGPKGKTEIMIYRKMWATLPAMLVTLTAPAMAADPDINVLTNNGSLERLFKKTGVYNASSTGKTPSFVIDPSWPQTLPNNWLVGQIGGLYVDQQDHIWIYNRPRTMTTDEAALDTRGGGDGKNGLGFARPNGAVADCCNVAPSVLEFDTAGKLLRAWGGPADPGWLESHCKPSDGCIWPNSEHGIYIDANDNVWLAGNGAK